MDPIQERLQQLTRRQFFSRSAGAVGTAALASLLPGRALAGQDELGRHHPARAKRIIYLFMSGAPSQFETFDWKPKLRDMFDEELPDSVRQGQRITTMTSGQ